jgi:hypothetical protein
MSICLDYIGGGFYSQHIKAIDELIRPRQGRSTAARMVMFTDLPWFCNFRASVVFVSQEYLFSKFGASGVRL